MLYDPKWEAETKVDPFSLDALIAWLETKPANEHYCYLDNGVCLIAQYLHFLGHRRVNIAGYGKWSSDRGNGQLGQFGKIAIGTSDIDDPNRWTFGQALKRARAA